MSVYRYTTSTLTLKMGYFVIASFEFIEVKEFVSHSVIYTYTRLYLMYQHVSLYSLYYSHHGKVYVGANI
jgi:hypothetical protein